MRIRKSAQSENTRQDPRLAAAYVRMSTEHHGGSRNALLGISKSIMLAEITANRVLDQVDPPE
jgi:hypothetical protein